MYVLTCIYRTMSSGFEHNNKHIFDTLEEASKYIMTEWYDSLCELNDYPSEWDEENFRRPMPQREDFTVEALQKVRGNVVFAPYHYEHAIIQNELHLQKVDKK